ncbi:MAG: hypothetical protein IKA72_02400 [Clostridia bacterium]|nr:hypothetical protein [Clostridia bacterium]
MKKIITVTDLCCERCARHVAEKLLLCEGVLKAKANYKKNQIFVEVLSDCQDEILKEYLKNDGYEVVAIEKRKGIFS